MDRKEGAEEEGGRPVMPEVRCHPAMKTGEVGAAEVVERMSVESGDHPFGGGRRNSEIIISIITKA